MGKRTRGEDDDIRPGQGTDPLVAGELSDATVEFPPVASVTPGGSEDSPVESGDPLIAEGESGNDDAPAKKRTWAGKRLVALIAAVAVVSLLAGVGIMQFIVSPAELAARTEAPEAGPVTAPIEERVIENTIVTRGEIAYADSVDVKLGGPSSEGPAVVTGHVPEVGAIFDAADIALEVTGRPVIVLPGELPAYRSLSIGMSGPDVLQLKQALSSLGLTSGDLGTQIFDGDTATGLGQLYQHVGYSAPNGGEEAQAALENAQKAVRSAETAVTISENTVDSTYNTQVQAQQERLNTINELRAAVNNAPDEVTRQQAVAELRKAEAVPEPAINLTVENAQLEEAIDSRTDAYNALTRAQEAVLPSLPLGEVLFLSDLPRRVDEVRVSRGSTLGDVAMSVSGAKLSIVGTLSEQDAKLLKEGQEAAYSSPSGDELTAKILKIEAPDAAKKAPEGQAGSATSDRYTVTFDPGELTPEQITGLQGSNVRVAIPVASTDGKVLAVPLAALSAGADGTDRVELSAPTKDDPFATEVVKVKAGLAAGGYVEISSDDSRIAVGAKVVVGR
ncbi:MAG: hypothetical protein QM705_14075 [Ancrocorticia sp.]